MSSPILLAALIISSSRYVSPSFVAKGRPLNSFSGSRTAMPTASSRRTEDVSAYSAHLGSIRLGYPLLRPSLESNPSTQPEVLLGDVGFIGPETGSFYRLFNVTVPADHPINEGRVLRDFRPLDFDEARDTQVTFLSNRPLSIGLNCMTDEFPVIFSIDGFTYHVLDNAHSHQRPTWQRSRNRRPIYPANHL